MKHITLISLQKNGAAPLDTLETSDALAHAGVSHTLILSAGNELRDSFVENANRRVIFIDTFASKKSAFVGATVGLVRPYRFIRAVAASRPDAIISTHFHPWLFFVRLYTKIRGNAWWYCIHESPFWNKEGRGAFEQSLEIGFLKKATGIFCYSEFIAQNIRTHLPSATVVPLPIGMYDAPSGVQNTRLTATKNGVRIICVGRMEPHKGIDMLVAAFRLLVQKTTTPCELVIAGSGTAPELLSTDANIHVYRRWLTIEEIAGLYAGADIVALPYANASQSGSPGWAMRYSLPTVCTNAGGLPEQILHEKNGLVVEKNDSVAFARALIKLVEDASLRTTMGSAAHLLGTTSHSWNEAARRMSENIQAT